MNETTLRKSLVELLRGGSAHLTVDDALSDLPADLRNRRVRQDGHSVWEILEHMRIAQEDILQYTLDPEWRSPAWPDAYWPQPDVRLSDETWNDTLKRFDGDLGEMIRMVQDPERDLTAPIPHAKRHTYLREALLVADHNAYHLGQIVDVRKALNAWR